MKVPAWAILCDDYVQLSDYAHKFGLDEIHQPAEAPVCRKVELVSSSACVSGWLNELWATSDYVY